jgi:hypothetical protein
MLYFYLQGTAASQ